MAIWKKKRACRTEKHNIRVWSYSSSPIEERLLHSGLVPDPFTSSLYFFLAFGMGVSSTLNLNAGFYQSYLQNLSDFCLSAACEIKSKCVCAQLISCVQLFATPWTATCQTLLSMESSRQEYWSGLPFPSPGHLPNPGLKPEFSASPCISRWILYHWVTWKAKEQTDHSQKVPILHYPSSLPCNLLLYWIPPLA